MSTHRSPTSARQDPQTPPAPTGWRRLLPHAVLSAALIAVWLLLQQSVAPAHLLSGAVLAVVAPLLARRFLGPAARVYSWVEVVRLSCIVLWDIVVSNLVVARIVLDPTSRPQPAWVRVPLHTRHPTAATLLAAIITTTPGTVSCVVDDERWEILVHALDLDDPQALIEQVRTRYEAPLRRIFEGEG
jgi:multicomponent K+:H+ antiporter subunit E